MKKGKHDAFTYFIPGWGPERKTGLSWLSPLGSSVPSSCSFSFALSLTSEGEVMKGGETALRHQVILLPIALWLRIQSPNYWELYLFCSFSLKGVAILSRFPFEVLFQWMANSSNDWRILWAWVEGEQEWWVLGLRLPDWKQVWPLFMGKYSISSALCLRGKQL